MRRVLTLAITAALCFPQQPEPQATIQVEVDLVNILCAVRDRKGTLIPNLAKTDFNVYEEGTKQDIKYFTRETDLPLTLGLLVDVSLSQERLIEEEKRAAYQFFGKVLRPKDMAFLISFGADTELLQDFTNSAGQLRAGLNRLRIIGGAGGVHPGPVPTSRAPKGTLLYDAVYLAATEKLKGEVGRKALVLITDGVDQGSSYTRDQAIEAAHKSDAIIYSVYYVDPQAYGGRGGYGGIGFGPSDADLKRISEETGGRLFSAGRKHTLDDIFAQIQEEMRSQYSLSYTPTKPVKDGSFRRLEIKTANKDLKVQARKGYYSIKP
jgi:VWFA-related protein